MPLALSQTGATSSSDHPNTAGTPAAPQDRVTLSFADSGDREVWIHPKAVPGDLPAGPTGDSLHPKDSVVELNLSGKAATDVVSVLDHLTGNLVTTTVAEVRAKGNLQLPAAAFKEIGSIQVHVEHNGAPLASANVTVDDGRAPQSRLLDPSTKGDLRFFELKPGSLKISVKYNVKDGSAKSTTQLVDAPLARKDLIPIATISVADDVATVTNTGPLPAGAVKAGLPSPEVTTSPVAFGGQASTATPTPATSPNNAAPKEQGSNPFGSFIIGIISLGVVVALAYVLFRYAKQNQDAVQSKLQQLGVDIPKPGDDPQQYDPVPVPAAKKPDPPQKIILGDADPSPIGTGPVPSPFARPASTVVLTGEPRLVSEMGDAMTLPEGETIVGREVGLGLSLVGETTVSRRHAQLLKTGNEVTVTDIGSTNGTYVNGVSLTSPRVLQPGDSVNFGSVRFRYEA